MESNRNNSFRFEHGGILIYDVEAELADSNVDIDEQDKKRQFVDVSKLTKEDKKDYDDAADWDKQHFEKIPEYESFPTFTP